RLFRSRAWGNCAYPNRIFSPIRYVFTFLKTPTCACAPR
ncbi:autotransporter beta-domain protein, partial [Chlamydia psittaci 02DC21]